MNCPNCGTENAESAKFCKNCATPLQPEGAAPVNQNVQPEPPAPASTAPSAAMPGQAYGQPQSGAPYAPQSTPPAMGGYAQAPKPSWPFTKIAALVLLCAGGLAFLATFIGFFITNLSYGSYMYYDGFTFSAFVGLLLDLVLIAAVAGAGLLIFLSFSKPRKQSQLTAISGIALGISAVFCVGKLSSIFFSLSSSFGAYGSSGGLLDAFFSFLLWGVIVAACVLITKDMIKRD